MGWSLLIVKRFYPFIGTREGVKDKLGSGADRLPGGQEKGNSKSLLRSTESGKRSVQWR